MENINEEKNSRKKYSIQEDSLLGDNHFNQEAVYGLIENIDLDYDLETNPFIGERGNETDIRFVMISDLDSRLTNLLISDKRVGDYLTSKHQLNWINDIVLVKDSLKCWDMLVKFSDNEENHYQFVSIHTKSLELAKERGLKLFWERELEL